MRELIAQGVKVQMCVTSPPYFGLRDYGHDGQLGLEATPTEYVVAMVEVFALVRELLSDDGVLWLNLGDTYSSSGAKGTGGASKKQLSNAGSRFTQIIEKGRKTDGLEPKQLIGIPWRVAFALQADGWYLRQDIIWHKPNPMPESVTDRCTKAHEYIFLLSKSARYHFNHEAIQELATGFDGRKDTMMKGSEKYANGTMLATGNANSCSVDGRERWRYKNLGEKGQQPHSMHEKRLLGLPDELSPIRNKRSVWTVPTISYSGAHFATFPPALIEPCILAGSRVGDTVLDPFFGSGTTGQVSQALGRKWIGCELNPAYGELQQVRTAQQGMEFV